MTRKLALIAFYIYYYWNAVEKQTINFHEKSPILKEWKKIEKNLIVDK